MTGNTEESGAGGAEWLAAIQMKLIEEVEAVLGALCKARPKADADSAALDRHARAIVNVARAARAAAGLTETPGRARPKADGEDMSKKADDFSPEELARIRDEFDVRLDRFHAALEQKRMDDGVVARTAAGPESGPGARAAVGAD